MTGLVDLLGLRRTDAFGVSISPGQVERTGMVAVTVAVWQPATIVGQGFDLGLVCTESYDYTSRSSGGVGSDSYGSSSSSRRVTAHATAYEQWQPLDRTQPTQSRWFQVADWAPFSYRGSALSYSWEVIAREHRSGDFDRVAEQPLWVLP